MIFGAAAENSLIADVDEKFVDLAAIAELDQTLNGVFANGAAVICIHHVQIKFLTGETSAHAQRKQQAVVVVAVREFVNQRHFSHRVERVVFVKLHVVAGNTFAQYAPMNFRRVGHLQIRQTDFGAQFIFFGKLIAHARIRREIKAVLLVGASTGQSVRGGWHREICIAAVVEESCLRANPSFIFLRINRVVHAAQKTFQVTVRRVNAVVGTAQSVSRVKSAERFVADFPIRTDNVAVRASVQAFAAIEVGIIRRDKPFLSEAIVSFKLVIDLVEIYAGKINGRHCGGGS